MSQAKVDRYKQEKADRKKIMAKEKAKKLAAKICAAAVAAAIVVWAGASFYTNYENNKPQETYYVTTDALDTYMQALDE